MRRSTLLILGTILALAAVLGVWASTENRDADPSAGDGNGPAHAGTPPTDLTSPPPPAGRTATPLALGTVRQVSGDPERPCPEGHACSRIEVTCPGVGRTEPGRVAIAEARAPARGLVMLFSGGGGTQWWTGDDEPALAFIEGLRDSGFEVVQVRWVRGWLGAPRGTQAGPARMACLAATAIRWVYDERYVPLAVDTTVVGQCGFCVSGNSGGASQVSYALSHYGLEGILDAVVPTSGPPHAALVRGCLPGPADGEYAFRGATARNIDAAYGSRLGPCHGRDASFRERWEADAVDTGGSDYVHPTTRVVFILGSEDRSVAPAHARDYVARLRSSGSPHVDLVEVAAMGHRIQGSVAGLETLRMALLARPGSDA